MRVLVFLILLLSIGCIKNKEHNSKQKESIGLNQRLEKIDTNKYILSGNGDTALVLFLYQSKFKDNNDDYDEYLREFAVYNEEKQKVDSLFKNLFKDQDDFEVKKNRIYLYNENIIDYAFNVLEREYKTIGIRLDMEYDLLYKARNKKFKTFLEKILKEKEVSNDYKIRIGADLKNWDFPFKDL